MRAYGIRPRTPQEHPAATATTAALRTVRRDIALPGDIDGWIKRLEQAATSDFARRDLLACLPGPARQGVMATGAKNLAAFDAAVSACLKYQNESIANAKVQARTDPDFNEIIELRETQLSAFKNAAAAARKPLV